MVHNITHTKFKLLVYVQSSCNKNYTTLQQIHKNPKAVLFFGRSPTPGFKKIRTLTPDLG